MIVPMTNIECEQLQPAQRGQFSLHHGAPRASFVLATLSVLSSYSLATPSEAAQMSHQGKREYFCSFMLMMHLGLIDDKRRWLNN